MAIAIKADGNDDYMLFDTEMSETATKWSLKWRAKPANAGSARRIIGRTSGSTHYIQTRHTGSSERIDFKIDNVSFLIVGGTRVTNDGEFHDYELKADGTTLEFFVDTLSKGTTSGSPVFDGFQCLFRGGSNYYEGQAEYFSYYNETVGSVLTFNWDASSSSTSSGTPVLTETVSGNNATGVNMPTAAMGSPGSAWINLGGATISIPVIMNQLRNQGIQ